MTEGSGPSLAGGRPRLRIRGPRDFYGGLALVALAVLALLLSRELPGQQGIAFGPGTAPRMFAGLLMIVGAVIAITGLLVDGPPLDNFAIRGPFYVLVGILVFAAFVRGVSFEFFGRLVRVPALGLVPATFLAFMVSIFGSSEFRLKESLIAAAVMTAFCVGLFVYLLQLPFQLWPQFLTG